MRTVTFAGLMFIAQAINPETTSNSEFWIAWVLIFSVGFDIHDFIMG